MGALTRDLRLAVRVLRKAPAFTVTAIITLALGIGANTAMFTVAQSVLWRPLAYAEPNRLVVLSGRGPVLSPLEIAEIQRSAKSFAEVGAYSNVSVTLSGTAEPERVAGASVSANWFRLLGRKPLLGRGFLTEDGQPGHGGVVVLSHSLWRRRFGADPGTIGRPLRINGESLTVVGVMPADLERVSDEDLWMPLVFSAADLSSGRTYLRAYARLRPGVSIGQARAELESISRGLERQHPESNAGRSLHLAPLQETLVSSARSPLLLLLGAVGFLMLLVCANLTHLELARAAAQRRDGAVRAALGASPGQLVRERLTGAVLLSLVGGACGMVLAFWGTRLLATMAANLDNIPRLEQTRIDARVLLFALLLSLITSLAFGLVPALQAVRVDLQSLVKEASGRAAGGLRSKQMRSVLLVSEVALALVLLVGAGLLGQSFWRLIQVAPGFRPEQCLAMRVVLPQGAPEATQIAFARRVLESLREVPSVRAAGLITNVPLTSSRLAGPVWIETSPPPIPGHEPTVDLDSVSPGFLEALGTPLIDGRSIQSSDRANTPGVAVVNRKMAERFWPGSDAIGKRISLEGPSGPWTTVVGVAGDIKRDGLDQEVGAQVYLPFEQQPAFFMTFVLRTAGDPAGVVAEARRAVWGVDPSQAVAWVRPMTDVVSASISKLRFVTALLALFAAIALVLAAVGMYGVMAHSVSQRSQEIAVRIALGAQRHDVVRMVMSNALSMTLIGLALGLACASVLTRFLKSVIFGVSATDPLTFAAISLLVIGMALTSTYIPARRAARVVPSRALKRE